MKKLIIATTFSLAIASAIMPIAQASGILRDSKAPHIVNTRAYPNFARVPNSTHAFDLHIQGRALEHLTIDLPQNIQVTKGIIITDNSGRQIEANVSVSDAGGATSEVRLHIAFAQPVPPETTISIHLKGINPVDNFGRTWLYPVSGRLVGIAADIPLGLARITTYD